jgi:hypothetical protein
MMVSMTEFNAVLEKVKDWPADVRLTLAQELLRSLHPPLTEYEITKGRAAQASALTEDQGQLLKHVSTMEKYG